MSRRPIAYIFERFPSFTQTFCVREIMELRAIGVHPVIFSIHDTRQEAVRHFPKELFDEVHFLPPSEQLVTEVTQLKEQGALPQSVVLTLRHWGDRGDKHRVYEAAWIGHKLQQLNHGVTHAHSHFAGLAARVCWWLRKFHGISYSFTAHANDIFCQQPGAIPTTCRLAKDASLIVTVSNYTANDLNHRYPEGAAHVRRVYNGLDLTPFIRAREQADRSQAAGGILSVGRLIEKKGFDDLIDACGLLRDRGIDFHCRIVGEGPLEESLRAQIRQLQLQQHVTLTGPLPMEQIIQLLAEHTQVFALACKTESDGGKDNLPTVLMEAMAASIPCVSTRLAGVPEMVINGETGLLCDECQPEALAGLIMALLQDPERCEAMGRAGLAHARRHFAKEITARHLLDTFAEHTSIRPGLSLILRHGLLGKLLRRGGPKLRQSCVKARDKTFDLEQFMAGA